MLSKLSFRRSADCAACGPLKCCEGIATAWRSLLNSNNQKATKLANIIKGGDWFDVEDYLAETDLITSVWADEISKAASQHIADNRWEAFALAGIRQYASAQSLTEVKIANLAKQAGYSRSTFFRVFDNVTKYQFHLFKIVSSLSVDVYQDRVFSKHRSPLEFVNFTINLFYSADCTIPNDWVETLWKRYGHCGFDDFNPQLPKISKVIKQYIQDHPGLGYADISEADIHAFVRLYERDILESRLGPTPIFPSESQSSRWKRMFLGLIADTDALRRISSHRSSFSFLKFYDP